MSDPVIIITENMPLEERLQGARLFCSRMFEWVKGRGKVIIILHDNPDPDCLASALALRHIFTILVGEEPTIAFSGMIARSENLIMAKMLEIPLVPFEIVNLSEYGVICMLDTQPGTGNNSLSADVEVDIVIDHHPLKEMTRGCRWVDVRSHYGVTATILYEYLLAFDLEISPELATAIFYAIKSDTQDLGREANEPDKDAYLKLFPVVDKQLLCQIMNPRQPAEYFRTIKRAIDQARVYGRAIVADMQKVAFPELVAEMADFLLKLEGVDAVLVYGEYSHEMYLSIRSVSDDMNAGEMMKRILEGIGSGGGHFNMAGGKISGLTEGADPLSRLQTLLLERFLNELGLADSEPVLIGVRE
jgi:nanoRNase/pAp phosphatase (c-di-AMP/oligoRNAs hydrolase)